MINRIVGRILTLPNIHTLKRFSTYDDSKNRNKGGSGKFFGKKESPKQEVNDSQSGEPGEKKQTHHKTVKFLKKNELKMKELQPQPKKQLRFRRKQSVVQGEIQKPTPFVRPEKQESEQQLIKKSIFFSKNPSSSKSQQEKAPITFSLPQLNQFLSSPAPENKFYERMSQDLDKILLLFEGRHWKDLNQIVQGYYQFTPAIQIEKQLHAFLISNDASLYVDWLRSLGRSYKDLSDSTLKKLYNELIIQNRLKELRDLLNFFKTRVFNVEYKSIQAVLGDIERDSPLRGLQQKVNDKIDIVLQILQIQLLYNQKNSASNKVVIYTLDEWFDKIAHLALNRQVGRAKFISLFQDIFIRHYSYINLQHIHAGDLFLRIIQSYYFGSYVTTQKLHLLFQDFLHQDEYQSYLVKLRDSIVQYKSKTGKFAFPNAKKLVIQFQKFYAKEAIEQTLFYYVLVNLSNEQKDLSSFMQKRKVILNYCQHQYPIREILNDALLNLGHNIIESKPVNAREAKIQKKKQDADKAKNKIKQKPERANLNQNLQFFGKKYKSNVQSRFEGKKSKLAWADYQQEKNQQQKGHDQPQKLGWSRNKRYNSYYSLLVKQIEEEGNPYRKQLLQNIIKAKLNVQTQQNIIRIGDNQLSKDNNPNNQNDKQVNAQTKPNKSNRMGAKQQGQKQQQSEEEQYDLDLEDLPVQIDLNINNKQKIDFNNKLAIKSAIKLQKYELAYALCQKIIMQPLIFSRTSKNISLVVKSFLLEENKRERIPNIQDILENVDDSILELTDEYLRSVYDRCENFDELIWNYVPPKEMKFQYWRTTLALDRAQDLIKIDVNGRLKDMKYQAQYDVLPVRERDQFINKNSKNWRSRLMDELGITHPLKDQEQQPQLYIFSDDNEFYEQILKEKLLDQEQFQQLMKENGGLIASQQIEGDQVQGQNPPQAEEVQAEAAAEGEEETAEISQTQAETAPEAVEDYEKGHQAKSQGQGQINTQAAHEISQQGQKSKTINQPSSEDRRIQESLEGYSNFDTSNSLRVKGYDFTSFLDLSRKKIKATFEQEYQKQKQYKKFVINLHSLAEQSNVEDMHYLQNKLFQYQRHVKSLDNIAIFASYRLWNFDFTQGALDPRIAKNMTKQFRQNFYNFKKYDGKKGYQEQIILDNQKMVDISEKVQLICMLTFSEAMIDDLLIRRMRFFKEAEAVVKLQPSKVVEELMIWGLQSDQPMAIYLAQKIAMLTNQMISHPVALQVSNYLSHRREIPAERIERCKQCLKVVGRINRDNIYDFNHQYQHITVRKNFSDYLEKRRKDLDSTALDFLSRVDPTHSNQIETFNLRNNMRRGHLVV